MDSLNGALSIEGFTLLLPTISEEAITQKTCLIVQQILMSDLNQEGLLRVGGTQSTTTILNGCSNEELPFAFKHSQVKTADLTSLLKLHLKENPIFTPNQLFVLDQLCSSSKVSEKDISDFISHNLSGFNKNRLVKIANLIKQIENNSSVNKMTRSNLNIAFSPTFLIPPSSGGTVLEDAYDRQSNERRKPTTALTHEEGLKQMQEAEKRQTNNLRLLNVILNKYA
ncbi:MAG: hypothetical protein KDK71_00520 [Chlamydiia bacterium]|nr:hypothetical protein [Chlamydiia bacterium]